MGNLGFFSPKQVGVIWAPTSLPVFWAQACCVLKSLILGIPARQDLTGNLEFTSSKSNYLEDHPSSKVVNTRGDRKSPTDRVVLLTNQSEGFCSRGAWRIIPRIVTT